MNLYTDYASIPINTKDDDCPEITPHHTYICSSMDIILNDIDKGILPVETFQPFPVVWNKNNY